MRRSILNPVSGLLDEASMTVNDAGYREYTCRVEEQVLASFKVWVDPV